MKQKAHARKATGAKKTRTTTLKAKAKAKASPKKQTVSKLAAKAKSTTRKAAAPQPRSRAKVESTLETPREPSRELESLTEQPKMKISRKDNGTFRENQRSQSQPNSVNPAGRR